MLRLLRRYFGPGPDRQDLCQEVFLRFFTRIDELRDRTALRSFLIGICLGVAQNELRRAKVRRWIFLTQSGDLPDAPINGSDPEAREATERVYKILAGVSAEDRSLFVTRYIEKMELAEIAVAIGRPLSTTKRRLARATRRIAARMSGDPALADYVGGLGALKMGEVMKVGDLNDDIGREQRCEALGDVIAEAIGTPAPGATGPLPEEVARVADAAAAASAARGLEAGARDGAGRGRGGAGADAPAAAAALRAVRHLRRPRRRVRDARQRHRDRALLRRDVDRRRRAQRGARPRAHARRRDHPPRSRAGVVRGRRTAPAPAGTSRSARSRSR